MNIKRLYTYVPSVDEGGERIKRLIADINIAKKAMKYSYATNIKIDLNGSLYTRRIELDRIDNIKVVNDQLKISFWVALEETIRIMNSSTRIQQLVSLSR
jgi:hypothetical protein